MTCLRFIPFGTPTSRDPERELRTVTQNRENLKLHMDETATALARINTGVIDAIGSVPVNERRNLGACRAVLWDIIRDTCNASRERRRLLESMEREGQQYAAYAAKLVDLHKQLAEAKSPYRELTQDNVNAALLKVPDTTAEIVDAENIRFTFNKVFMTPDRNPYTNLNNGGKVSVPLPPITAFVNLPNATINLDSSDKRTGGFGKQAHPHALSEGRPCLGGFEGVYYDACQKADIEVIALALRMFLEQANNGDTAGREWAAWLPMKILCSCEGLWAHRVGSVIIEKFKTYRIDSLGRAYIGPYKLHVKDRHDNRVPVANAAELAGMIEQRAGGAEEITDAKAFIANATYPSVETIGRIL
jgi:hypothetical protein